MNDSISRPQAAGDDFVESLGSALLAHRLRRTSNQVLQSIAEWQVSYGQRPLRRSASTLLLLERRGPLGVMEIASRLKVSHPLIIRIMKDLELEGLCQSSTDAGDARRRYWELTETGRAEATRARGTMKIVEAAVEELFEEIGVDFLEALGAMDRALERRSLAERLDDAEK